MTRKELTDRLAEHRLLDISWGSDSEASISSALDHGTRYIVTSALAPSKPYAVSRGVPVLAGAITPRGAPRDRAGGRRGQDLSGRPIRPRVSERSAGPVSGSPAPPGGRRRRRGRPGLSGPRCARCRGGRTAVRGCARRRQLGRAARRGVPVGGGPMSVQGEGAGPPGSEPQGTADGSVASRQAARPTSEADQAAGVEVLTVGETMTAVRCAGPMKLGGDARITVAGAEINLAIELARLGHRAAWSGRLGANDSAELILRAEGVETSPGPGGRHRPAALRRPASGPYQGGILPLRLCRLTLNPRILHITGITAALPASAREGLAALAAESTSGRSVGQLRRELPRQALEPPGGPARPMGARPLRRRRHRLRGGARTRCRRCGRASGRRRA